jgi:protein CpxP
MSRKYLKWTAVIVLAVTGIAAAGWAQMKQEGMGPGRHRFFMGYLAKQLQLTDAQKAQIKTMWQAQKTTMQPLLQQLASGRQQMLAATANGQFDQAKVTAIAQQQAPVIAQLMVAKQQLISQVYNQVLTPDQRTKADQMRAKHEQRLEKWLQPTNTSTTSN